MKLDKVKFNPFWFSLALCLANHFFQPPLTFLQNEVYSLIRQRGAKLATLAGNVG